MDTGKPFFGWLVVGGMFVNYMAIIGIIIYTLPLFYPSLIAEFGWSASQVTMAATLCYFTGALLTPLVSPLFDRYPVRKFMAVGTVAVILALVLYGRIETIPFMLGVYFLFALGQVFSGPVPAMLVISRWFQRRRGLAMGIVLTSTSVGGAVFPLIVQRALAVGDWRQASLILAGLAAVMLSLPLIFLIRSRPEDKGLLPDGDEPLRQGRERDPGPEGPTLRQALRTPQFWLLAFSTGALWFCVNGLLQHQTIIMSAEKGVDAATLPLVVSVYFWFAILGKILFGWLGDRHDKNLVMLQGIALVFAGLLALRYLTGNQLFLYAALFGMGFGATFTMIQLLFAEYYAGRHYGRILGLLTMVDVGAGGLGIPAMGLLREALGSYMPVLDGLIVLAVIVAACVLLLYKKRDRNVVPPAPVAQ